MVPAITRRTLLGGAMAGACLPAGLFGKVAFAVDAEPADKTPSQQAKEQLPITGTEVAQLRGLDEMLRAFVTEHALPGAALAIARQGKVIYSRGFGYANREVKSPVVPDSLFRVASISKPFTAVAVLQLVQQGKLKIDLPVWDYLQLPEPKDEKRKQITIEQLLHHTGGFDRGKSFDPMFRSRAIAEHFGTESPATTEQIMRYMVQQHPLDFSPGAQFAYSNFGYCVLGRVIEKAAVMAYEAYVQKHVCAPLGVTQMKLGKTLAEQVEAREVGYYDGRGNKGSAVIGKVGTEVKAPYGVWCLETMDAHGGWIASASDLVRFASALRKREDSPLLNPAMMDLLLAAPEGSPALDASGKPKPNYYGSGWQVQHPFGLEGANAGRYNLLHSGHFGGTSTLLVQRYDELAWAALFNSDCDAKGVAPASIIDPLIVKVMGSVQSWPEALPE